MKITFSPADRTATVATPASYAHSLNQCIQAVENARQRLKPGKLSADLQRRRFSALLADLDRLWSFTLERLDADGNLRLSDPDFKRWLALLTRVDETARVARAAELLPTTPSQGSA